MLRPAHHPTMQPLRRAHATRRIVGLALLALLLAQWSALVHVIAHGPGHRSDVVAAADQDEWGHPAGSPACQLFDHLLAGQAPGFDSAPAPVVPTVTAPAARPAPWAESGPEHRAYQARAPPRD